MKTTALALIGLLALFPGSAYAASLYDGEGLYVQAAIDLGLEATSTLEVDTGSVTTEADLAAYTESLETEDKNIDRAEAEVDGDVTLSYYHPARLFGIFPVRAKSTTVVSVGDNGMLEAKTSMPWWSFLATGTGKVAGNIDAELSNSGQILTDMKVSGSAAAKARVLEAITSAHARAAVSAAGI
jgi:hypothetical protein